MSFSSQEGILSFAKAYLYPKGIMLNKTGHPEKAIWCNSHFYDIFEKSSSQK